jgi:transposase-like protein
MKIPTSMSRLKGFRHPREFMTQAFLAYHGFALSTVDVEDRLAQRGVNASREAIRHTPCAYRRVQLLTRLHRRNGGSALPSKSRLSGENLALPVA